MSSTATSAEHGSAKQVNSRGRVIVASLIGTTVEFYDFYVYATAAVLVFPKLFFPGQNETTQLLSSFAVFGVAFIARPLGSVVFGHFGDKFGRKGTLVASLLTMGIATFLIGCLPTATRPGLDLLGPGAARGPALLPRAWPSAANGAARPCWPPRTPRRTSAPSTARSRSWAPRSASSSPT